MVMFAFGRPPSGSGLRLWAAKGAGVKFRSLYAVTVCSGDLGPTTKKSAVEPRLEGGTVCPHTFVKVMVTTGRSPARKKAPFTGLETATAALSPPGCRHDEPPPPPGPGGPASPGDPSGPRSPIHPIPSAMTPAPSSDSANLIAVPFHFTNRTTGPRGTVSQPPQGKRPFSMGRKAYSGAVPDARRPCACGGEAGSRRAGPARWCQSLAFSTLVSPGATAWYSPCFGTVGTPGG